MAPVAKWFDVTVRLGATAARTESRRRAPPEARDHLLDIDLLSVLVICHDPDEWLARLDGSLRQTLSPQHLRLDRYGVDELGDSLEVRARVGLRGGVVARDQLERIADEVAGVARFGIQALREAARAAEDREHDRIQEADVDDCFERARRRVREANLASLPFRHRLLYELIRDTGAIEPAAPHDRYEQVADAVYRDPEVPPISQRERRRKLTKLDEYDLVDQYETLTGRQFEHDRFSRTLAMYKLIGICEQFFALWLEDPEDAPDTYPMMELLVPVLTRRAEQIVDGKAPL